jgi:hypothetical protein
MAKADSLTVHKEFVIHMPGLYPVPGLTLPKRNLPNDTSELKAR